ncbi:MAG: hypothetical protein IPL61_14440 [Myxococcales bacterium]|nr:hypothetical protein [Myxococcales bacterium]
MNARLPTQPSDRPARSLDLDWDTLEIAVERNASDSESFLDLTTGKVVTITAGEVEAALRRQQVADNPRGYLRVEPASSREQYRWMEKFVGSVADEGLRERLIMSIDGKGAFRRFKDVLLAFPAERERWFSYRAELLHWHIHNWLETHQITGTNPPPWGEVGPPAELPVVEGKPVTHGAEAPGEALRRRGRELLEGIPAIDLPSAIAFLEFLRARGGDVTDRADRDDRLDDEADDDATGDPQRAA